MITKVVIYDYTTGGAVCYNEHIIIREERYMTNLKNNIDHYMKLKGIRMYSHLLIDIAHELGIKGEQAYEFVDREKSNFSKMLKGERPLKYEFIIPLEKIFGVSLARLLEEDAYKLPIEKGDIPFNKGFRYYAYLDDMKLYKEEFDLLLAKDGTPIISQTDEFGKTFLDYVVEYRAVNAVRYLHEEYGIKLKWFRNSFDFSKSKGVAWIDFNNSVEFARLVASMNDAELFNDIFDSYNMFFTNGHYGGKGALFSNDEYFEILLDNDHLFMSIFEIKQYQRELGTTERRKKQVDAVTYYTINPIINNCLRYSLQHLDRYKHRAVEILKFAITYNRSIANEIAVDDYYICNELGGLRNYKDDYYCLVIFADVGISDAEIKGLIDQLPKFRNNNYQGATYV